METLPEVDVVLPGAEVAGEPLLADGEAAPELAEGNEGCPSPEELVEELGGHGYVLNGVQRTGPNGEAPVSESQLARAGEDEEGEEEDAIEELVAMEPGQMRLQGSFTGVATTHSHQLDLAVGLDVEMPSEMAAEAIRQISRRSRSSSPMRARLASPSPQRPLELPDERRTLWNTLSDFFRRDAREGARQAAAASPPRSLPDIKLKMDDASSFKQESQRLALDLESSQGQSAQLEAQLLLLTEERDGLRSRLEVLTQEFSEQAMHMDGLRDQSARVLSSGDTLQGELAEREAEVREVQARLAEATQGFDAARADLTKEQLSRDRLESSLAAARRSHELIADENRALKVQAAELSAQVEIIAASLEGRMQVVQESLDLSEQQLTAVRCERDGLAARVMALETDHGEQGSQVAAAEAQARAAAEARAQALEVQVRELQEACAAAAAAASGPPERDVEQEAALQREALALQERCASLEAALELERAAKAEALACRAGAEADGEASAGLQRQQLQECLGKSEALRQQVEELRAELKKREEAKAVVEAQAVEARGALTSAHLALEKLKAEHDRLLAQASQQAQAAPPQSAREAELLRGKLQDAAAEVAAVSAELSKVRGEAASQERAAGALRTQHLDALNQAADMQAKVLELETQHGDAHAKQVEEAQRMAVRLDAAEKEAAEAGERARKAAEERDQARQELRQERQAGLGTSAKVKEEAHALRQGELRASVRVHELEEEVKQLRAKCSLLAQESLAARSSVVVSEPMGGGPILLQDPSVGGCVIQTLSAMPTAAALSATLPRSYRISRASVARSSVASAASVASVASAASVPGKTVKHIGTTTRTIGAAAPGSPVPTIQTAVPTSSTISAVSPPTSPLGASVGPLLPAPSPVGTAQGPAVVVAAPAPGAVATAVPTTSAPPAYAPIVVASPKPAMVTYTRRPSNAKQVYGNVSVQILGVRRIQ